MGVILSKKEGACYASVEYLLSGLPVVSTVSMGGRDVFLDERFCRIVKSNSRSISKAINELRSLKISPNFIRDETLKKLKLHEERFKYLLKNILDEYKVEYDNYETYWSSIYKNKMIEYANVFPVKL